MRTDLVGGGQFNGAIKQIMEAESKPVKQLEGRKTKEEARLKLFQEFKGKFSNFDRALAEISNPTSFKEYKYDLGDGTTKMGVTLDKTKVQPGTYEIEIGQLANRSSVVTNGFEKADEAILGSGYVVVYNPQGDKEEIYIGSNEASLHGIARKINSKSDGSIRATVMKDDSDPEKPWRLMIAAKNEGVEQEVIFPEFYFLDGKEDLFIDTDREAQNAILKLNGYELEAGQNKIPDFLSGVTADLKQADAGKPFTLKISEDIPKMAAKIKGVVDQINGILEFINKQNQVDDKSDTSQSFAGDTSLQSIEYRLRNVFHEGFPVWDNVEDPDTPRLKFLNQMGVEFDKAGKLGFSEEKFTKALEKDFEGVVSGLTGEYGFVTQVRDVMAGYTRPGNGMLATREATMRNKIKRIDNDIEMKQRNLQRRQENLLNQFGKLEATLNGMKQQQAYVSSALANSGGNMISQLMGG